MSEGNPIPLSQTRNSDLPLLDFNEIDTLPFLPLGNAYFNEFET